jgi:hypothetical protein
MKLRPLSKVRAMSYVYQEYPKWIVGPDVIGVASCGNGRETSAGRKPTPCSAAALALELAPEILALRAGGSSYREIAQALNECGRPTARGGRWAAGTLLRLMRRSGSAAACAHRLL